MCILFCTEKTLAKKRKTYTLAGRFTKKKNTAFKKADREIDGAGSGEGVPSALHVRLILFQAIYVRSSRGRKRIVYHAES